jgi:hypothetical protein
LSSGKYTCDGHHGHERQKQLWNGAHFFFFLGFSFLPFFGDGKKNGASKSRDYFF